jgi:GNAT superfamily N-acetyltransferase
MPTEIRKPRKDEYADVSEMRHSLWRLHSDGSRHIDAKALAASDSYSDLKSRGTTVLVLTVDDKIAGYALITVKKAENFFNFERYLYLDEMFLKRGYRGMGLGYRLLATVLKESKRKRLPVIARIYPFSREMAKLFERNGGKVLHTSFIIRGR